MGIFDRNDQSRGPGISGRLIGAILIALVGFMMYMSQVQENPVTGQRQHVAISPEQEIRLGLQSAPEMTRKMGGELPDTDPRVIEVRKIGNYVLEHTDAKRSPWKFKFHVLADQKTVNAFALPGGQVFITLGLLNKMKTEAQLAGVLSHEMGHVIERHSAEQMAKSQLGQMLVVAVGAAASDPNSSSGNSPIMIASMVNQMIQLKYSRGDELEADMWGVKLMEQAGFNPQAMVQVLEILKAVSGSGQGSEMFQTHPDPDRRISDIKAYLLQHPPKEGLSEGGNLSTVLKNDKKML